MPFVSILILVNKKVSERSLRRSDGKQENGLWIFTGIAMGACDGMLGPPGTLAIIHTVA